jgi:hypothetical protein
VIERKRDPALPVEALHRSEEKIEGRLIAEAGSSGNHTVNPVLIVAKVPTPGSGQLKVPLALDVFDGAGLTRAINPHERDQLAVFSHRVRRAAELARATLHHRQRLSQSLTRETTSTEARCAQDGPTEASLQLGPVA